MTLVGFSMGGGEVARYLSTYGSDRVASAVLAAAVPPFLGKTDDNPDGALDDETMNGFLSGVRSDRLAFLEGFIDNFFDADGRQTVSDAVKRFSWNIASGASPKGTHDCVLAFSKTDFRQELGKVDVPVLVLHGDKDGIVPFEASGARVPEIVAGAKVVVIAGGPHGVNVSHSQEFNQALLDFCGD